MRLDAWLHVGSSMSTTVQYTVSCILDIVIFSFSASLQGREQTGRPLRAGLYGSADGKMRHGVAGLEPATSGFICPAPIH